MAWRRKKNEQALSESSGTSDSMEVVAVGDRGLIVQGSSPGDVAALVDQMIALTSEGGGATRQIIAEGLPILADVAAFKGTHRQYIEFSERTLNLLKERGAIPTEDGYFRSFVRKGREFAGNLDWKPVDLGPEQALAMQTAAAQLALRAAIKDVVAAIERVEGKVDQLVKLARAERLGAAAGDRKTLEPIVDRVRSTGHITATDWSTIAPLGPLISRDIESLRAFTLRQLKDVKESPFARSRADEAEDLAAQLLKESVALLVVVEQNYALWQELRLAHARSHEPSALQRTADDVRSQLDALRVADQELIRSLEDVSSRLLAPTGFEGFAPLQKRRLRTYGRELEEVMAWFSDQRHLDREIAAEVEYPGLGDSLGKTRDIVSSVARRAKDSLVETSDRVLKRGSDQPRGDDDQRSSDP